MSARRLLMAVLVAGCVGSQDDPSQVHDLRVLGIQMDPPEIMLKPPMGTTCFGLFAGLAAAAGGSSDAGFSLGPILPYLQPIDMTWLIEDPDGGGRDISWELRACASADDLTCDGDAGFVVIDAGVTHEGELHYQDPLAAERFTDGGFLLLSVFNDDTFKGLDGIRMPTVMHLKAGSEEIYAQKLMVYSCQIFPDMEANVQPVMPGITVDGEVWNDGVTQTLMGGNGPPQIEPMDFTALEESYVVPAFDLKEVHLQESWKVSYYASVGRISPATTGGTDFTGTTDLQITNWHPGNDGGIPEQDVDFWFVVRDGRGGESWLQRKAHYIP